MPWLNRISVRHRVSPADENAVAVPADFDRVLPIGRRENHALARRKNGHQTDRRSRLALRKRGHDMKTVAFDGVVGDTRYVAEVDALGLDRTQSIGMGGSNRGEDQSGGKKHVADCHDDLLWVTEAQAAAAHTMFSITTAPRRRWRG